MEQSDELSKLLKMASKSDIFVSIDEASAPAAGGASIKKWKI